MTCDMIRLLQFLLWCLSIQKSRQAAMSRSNSETFPDLIVGASDFISGGTTTRFGTLHNKASGKYVRIVDRSHIDAKAEEEDPDALLILRTISFNEMVIQGNSSKYYLCVNSKGEFVARKRRKERGIVCSFSETLSHKRYNEYHVFQHPGWLLGFKGNGEQRKAQRNKPDHKSALFFFYQAETDDRIRKDENRFNELFEEVVREDEALRNREKRLRKFTEPSRRSIEDSHR